MRQRSEQKPAARFGTAQKPLSELTDAELVAEVQERRRRRGATPDVPPLGPGTGFGTNVVGPPSQIVRYLASLELKANARLDEVEAAYARLEAKYRPFLLADSPERRDAAQHLLASLRHAYEQIKRHSEAPGD